MGTSMSRKIHRRTMLGFAPAMLAAGPALAQSARTAAPRLTHVLTFTVQIGPGVEAGQAGGGRKRIVPITGGTVEGRFSGRILPGGADWQTIRPNGVTDIWARYTVQPDGGGEAIVVTNPGVRRASAEVSAKLAAGEVVDPSAYYFRASPQFETGSPAHQWLTENTFVCVGERWPDRVTLKIYQVE